MEFSSINSENNVYTGSLKYNDMDCQFVFSNDELRLIPLFEDQVDYMWAFGMKEISKGVYTFENQPRMEQNILIGKCNENGKQFIFLPRLGAPINHRNSVLFIKLEAYIIFNQEHNAVDKISFSSPEINCIHPVNTAVEYSFADDGLFGIKTKDFKCTSTKKQEFIVDNKKVVIGFGIARSLNMALLEPPITLNSNITFEFEKTKDYRFILKLWYIAKQFLQFLFYRKDVYLNDVKLASSNNKGSYEYFASLHIVGENHNTNVNALKSGRYIQQKYISENEGKILSDIAADKIYLRHLPETYESGKHIDAAKFVMITAAFEWEFNRLYPNGISKSSKRLAAEQEAKKQITDLIESNSGKVKSIYKSLLRSIERSSSLANKIEKIGFDYAEIIDAFGNQLYGFNNIKLNYSDIGKRLADQRNHFAHGDLDKDFINESLLDLVFLERIIYAMQLKAYDVTDKQIQKSINDLFKCGLMIE